MYPAYPCGREDIQQMALKWLRHILIRNGSKRALPWHYPFHLLSHPEQCCHCHPCQFLFPLSSISRGEMGSIIWRKLKGDKAVNKYHCSCFIYVLENFLCSLSAEFPSNNNTNNIIVINIIFLFRGAGASNANSDEQEMKTNLVDKEGGPNHTEP